MREDHGDNLDHDTQEGQSGTVEYSDSNINIMDWYFFVCLSSTVFLSKEKEIQNLIFYSF